MRSKRPAQLTASFPSEKMMVGSVRNSSPTQKSQPDGEVNETVGNSVGCLVGDLVCRRVGEGVGSSTFPGGPSVGALEVGVLPGEEQQAASINSRSSSQKPAPRPELMRSVRPPQLTELPLEKVMMGDSENSSGQKLQEGLSDCRMVLESKPGTTTRSGTPKKFSERQHPR